MLNYVNAVSFKLLISRTRVNITTTPSLQKKVCSATAGSETEISDAAYPKVVFVTSFYDDAD